jgi:hypothetical protein
MDFKTKFSPNKVLEVTILSWQKDAQLKRLNYNIVRADIVMRVKVPFNAYIKSHRCAYGIIVVKTSKLPEKWF